jgi:glyoxylase-like metal-dependent hydrolase (beta-lactamase superfamily II)
MKLAAALLTLALIPAAASAQSAQPKWCSDLPHPHYDTLRRMALPDTWFEVYQVAPYTFAIYEPRQSEGTISYLIAGRQRAVLFDSGMGIGDIKKVATYLTKLPIVVINSHTHNDHVGGNWQFSTIYGMDTDFTRKNAQGSSADAQQEISPDQVCGELPEGFDRKSYATKPWKISKYIHDGEVIDLGGRSVQVLATPGHTPDAICLLDKTYSLLFTGDTFYPGTIWLYRPETDLNAYQHSIERLATLVPELRSVLGAHDFPAANPSVLTNLVEQFAAVRSGKIQPEPAGDGKSIYHAEGIAFLMKAQQ